MTIAFGVAPGRGGQGRLAHGTLNDPLVQYVRDAPRSVAGPRVIEVAGGSTDTTPPVTVFVAETVTRVSRVTGFDVTDVTWSVDEDCQAWQIREVASAADTVNTGTLLVSGGAVPAGTNQITTVNSANLTAGDASKLLKIFAQDLAGNWTT